MPNPNNFCTFTPDFFRMNNPNDEEALAAEIRKSFKAMCMIELDIEHITGKEAIELVRMHK